MNIKKITSQKLLPWFLPLMAIAFFTSEIAITIASSVSFSYFLSHEYKHIF